MQKNICIVVPRQHDRRNNLFFKMIHNDRCGWIYAFTVILVKRNFFSLTQSHVSRHERGCVFWPFPPTVPLACSCSSWTLATRTNSLYFVARVIHICITKRTNRPSLMVSLNVYCRWWAGLIEIQTVKGQLLCCTYPYCVTFLLSSRYQMEPGEEAKERL